MLLGFSIYDPIHTSATTQQVLQKLVGIVSASAEGDSDADNLLSHASSVDPYEEEDEEDGAAESEDTNQPIEAVEKRKRRLKLARLKRKATQRAYEFTGFSDLAGVLFLEISNITDLPPERNSKNFLARLSSSKCFSQKLTVWIIVTRTSFDMDPFVVISLGKKTYKTKVIRHNLNPVYDEKLVFQVMRHETNYSLHFSVVDRDKLSGNDYIGAVDFPLERVSSVAPDADPTTGLYPLREPEPPSTSSSEAKKSRFRLPLSRSSSAQSLQKLNSRSGLHQSPSQTSLNGTPQSSEVPTATPSNSGQDGLLAPTQSLSIQDSLGNDDGELRSYSLPLTLKHKERWEARHKPVLRIKAKYLPYRALRQQFWRALLRQYDADDSGNMNKVELTTMLDTLGSTLREITIDNFFKRFETEALTYDQAVMCLEDCLQSLEEQHSHWYNRKPAPDSHMEALLPSRSRDQSDSPTPSNYHTPMEDRGDLGKTSTMPHQHHGPPGEEGDTIDANDLADDRGEEHVVEIRECPICHQPRMAKKTDSDIITHIATCASQDWRQVNNIVMAGFVTSSQAQRKWYSKVVTKIGYGGYKLGANSANILVQDRITGQINEERMSVYVRLGIRLLYKGLKSKEMERRRSEYIPHATAPFEATRAHHVQYASFYVHCPLSKAASTTTPPRPPRYNLSSTSISWTCRRCFFPRINSRTSTSSSIGR